MMYDLGGSQANEINAVKTEWTNQLSVFGDLVSTIYHILLLNARI